MINHPKGIKMRIPVMANSHSGGIGDNRRYKPHHKTAQRQDLMKGLDTHVLVRYLTQDHQKKKEVKSTFDPY